jgi:hypothetical protein
MTGVTIDDVVASAFNCTVERVVVVLIALGFFQTTTGLILAGALFLGCGSGVGSGSGVGVGVEFAFQHGYNVTELVKLKLAPAE